MQLHPLAWQHAGVKVMPVASPDHFPLGPSRRRGTHPLGFPTSNRVSPFPFLSIPLQALFPLRVAICGSSRDSRLMPIGYALPWMWQRLIKRLVFFLR
ncbi:hypothetical protein LMG33810_001958 [Carnimonas sp. LMG 33810]